MTFTIVLTRDEDDPKIYNASVPALPGCHTWGHSKREAYKHAAEAIAVYLEAVEAEGDPIPVEAGSKEMEFSK